MKCSCSSKGALAGMKDPGPLQEAIARGDLSTAKSLLGTAEFGEHRFVFANDCQLITGHSIQYDTIAVPLAPECCYEAGTLSEVELTLEVYAAISFEVTPTDM